MIIIIIIIMIRIGPDKESGMKLLPLLQPRCAIIFVKVLSLLLPLII